MADKSAIEWTDASWNPVRGCSRVSRGCGGPGKQGGCYAEAIAARFSDPAHEVDGVLVPAQPFHGFAEMKNGEPRWTGKVELIEHMLTLPLRWKKPRRIFVNSMSDLFHENLPDDAIDRIFAVMALCPQHTFQVLTKRPERMRAYLTSTAQEHGDRGTDVIAAAYELSNLERPNGLRWASDAEVLSVRDRWPLPNVWLGTSCEDQETADERISILLDTPAAIRFVSLEPLLGPIDLESIAWPDIPGHRVDVLRKGYWCEHGRIGGPCARLGEAKGGFVNHSDMPAKLDWVIVGGESGPNARPMHPDWVRSLRDQCAAAGVPFFFKQWGEWSPGKQTPSLSSEYMSTRPCQIIESDCVGVGTFRVGKKAAGRLLDGKEHNEFPQAPA